MFVWLLGPVRFTVKALATHDSPRQLALGLVLGMVIGLLPKGNLTVLILGSVLFATRVNLGIGLAAAAVFSWFGLALDPFAHKLGWIVLTYQPLRGIYARLYDLPLVAWSDLNNTVVAGQLILGAYLAYPAYCISLPIFKWIHPRVVSSIRKYRMTRILFGIDLGMRWGLNR
ncbi:MAG: TIGR03546 family protein [Pirellulales bacterium]|nr:TIGR03546 family protein [Pirellulales bacterium]